MPCNYCKKSIDIRATRCPYCQAQFTPEEVAARKKAVARVGAGCAVVLLLVAAISMCSGSSDKPTEVGSKAASPAIQSFGQPASQIAAIDAGPSDGLTSAQANAVRSAREYLNMSGFSRKGLIHQLSSSSGEGFDVADATVAVDSLGTDWNEQAVRSAKSYLEMSGFSCRGLIHQLSSSSGEGFTRDQAEYGAKQAGAC
jgi:hypothetical protein